MRISFDNDIFGVTSYFDSINPESNEGLSIDVQFVSQEDPLRPADAPRSPFATNPNFKLKGRSIIVYNKQIIDKIGFTPEELFGQVAHEIGHINKGFLDSQDQAEITANEISCDSFACECGLGLALASALVKMSEYYEVYGLNERLEAIGPHVNLFRPEWTTGRYDQIHKAAIFYNLIEGMSYFFEDYSAVVLGPIINLKRNHSLSLKQVADITGIAIESLVPFFVELSSINLVSTSAIKEDAVLSYRRFVSSSRKSGNQIKDDNPAEHLPMDVSNAEMLYSERVGGITSIMLELTYRCSEKCIHCYNPGATRNDKEINHRGERKELELSDYKKLIDEFYDQGLIKVCLSGGDPFSKSIVWQILDYLYSKNIAIDIFTNGQAIVNETQRLANYYPRLVGVSIYSGVAEDHDYITRVKGSWEKSISVLKSLSESAVPLDLKCCVIKTNVSSYHSVINLAKVYGATPQIEVSVADSIEGDKCVSKYLRLPPEHLEVVLRDPYVPLYVGKEAPNYGGEKKTMDRFACGAGRFSLCVTPEGDVIPCCALHLVFGNVTQESIVSIVTSEKRQKWCDLKLCDYEECGRHEFCDYCNLCPGVNHSEHGTPIKAGENNCYMAKVRYSLANKLKNDNDDPLQGNPIEEALSLIKNTHPDICIEK